MDDFTFYLKFTKPLILNLPNLKDRAMAALWLNKLTEINESIPKDNLHVEYLKLLLFALQKNNLTGIFTEHPPEGLLPHHPEMNTVMDMIKLVIPTKKLSSSLPSIYTIIGGDMSEFVAIQEIPNFGLHGYYAISNEPLPLWTQNKTELLKNNENTKKKSRFKDSLKYKMFKEINFQQTASQNNHIPNEMDTKEESERKEISTNETRPCWRTNRYFEKLLDQSPHIATDLEVTTADTLLHILKEKKLDKKEIKNDSCVLSVKKRQFEKMSNFTPFVYESGFDKIKYQSDSEEQLKQNVGIDGINCCRRNNIPSKSFSNIDTKVKYILNKLFARYKFI
ncbi:uncharacterized protein LOC124953020 isoform X1 [Vespa velutina]|uniref:uncharacterized protein LOC124953020 isoform X1 n=1 Tax=Vespa velutina TaxID=202808 RepID=UPI001FB2EA33|nr:uncharacterized protein LOC124953020 isoform X1 [Vespa velutina]